MHWLVSTAVKVIIPLVVGAVSFIFLMGTLTNVQNAQREANETKQELELAEWGNHTNAYLSSAINLNNSNFVSKV